MRFLLFSIFCIVSLPAFLQVTGVVTDTESKEPVPFANSWVKNEEKGVSTDECGKFSFEDSLTNKVFIVSALGYETKKTIDQRTLILPNRML